MDDSQVIDVTLRLLNMFSINYISASVYKIVPSSARTCFALPTDGRQQMWAVASDHSNFGWSGCQTLTFVAGLKKNVT